MSPSPREGRAGRGLGRGVWKHSSDMLEMPLSLTLSPLLRRGERELAPGIMVVPPRYAPPDRKEFRLQPSKGQTPPRSIEREFDHYQAARLRTRKG